MLDAAQKAVTDFNKLFGLPVSDSPRELLRDRVELRAKWMSEEIEEFRAASDGVDQLDAVADLIYYALGIFVEMGIEGGRVFEFVHHANMTKVRPGEQPVYNSEGKVLKPEGWIPPKEQIRSWLCSVSPKEAE
jgi:predicted HAD superfamily Cof-like phosphohydrolase